MIYDKKDGEIWIASTPNGIYSTLNAFIEMSPANNYKKYPIGFFIGDVFDPNG